jgi:potassium efflux system protein
MTCRLSAHCLAVVLGLLAILPPAAVAQQAAGEVQNAVTTALLEARIAETESAGDLPEESRNRLLSLYQRALSSLEEASANSAAAQAFRDALQTAPAEARAIREKLTASSATEANAPVPDSTALADLEAFLQQDRGDLALTRQRIEDLSQQLDEAAARPAAIRQRLREVEAEQTENLAQRQLSAAAGEGSAEAQARQWALQTQAEALAAETEMLGQERRSQPARVALLEAKRDRAARNEATINRRIALLEDLLTRRRQADAEQVQAAAQARRLETEGRHPAVVELADSNAALSGDIAKTVTRLDEIRLETASTERLQQQLEGDFDSAQEVIAIGGANLSGELGNLLRQQRQDLPDLRTFERAAREREKKASEAGVKRVLHRREQQRLADMDATVEALLAAAGVDVAPPSMRTRLVELVEERGALLSKAVESETLLLRRLADLEAAQSDLLTTIQRFDELLDVNLLWVRSASRTELAALGALPDQVWRVISPSGWTGVAGVLVHQATHSAVFVLLGVGLAAFLMRRKHLIRFIESTSERLGKPTTDRVVYSWQALLATLAAAAAWPLVAAVVGWQLQVSPRATDFSVAVGGALVALAMQFYSLRALRLMCIPNGLANAHFGWPETSVRLLRRELDRLSWTYLPAAGVLLIIVSLDPLNAGWAAGRAAFLLIAVALALAFFRLLHPTSGVVAHAAAGAERRPRPFLYPFWYPLLVIAPLALAVLDLLGYLYTATILLDRFVQSTWLVVALMLLTALAQRWVKVARRRIAYDQAMERRQAACEARRRTAEQGEGEDVAALPEVEEPEIDLDSLSDTTGDLIRTAVVAAGLVGLWIIWSDVIPALRVLDKVSLWQQTVMVDGEERLDPITLGDLGLALVIGIATFVFAKQLPAVLEMILLRSADITAGGRYTVTTLTTYAIITVGLLVVFALIGVQWSQLQWLVAALGVGIGFGLQEIVANFISGLIILFERPVRVGDVVTVGDTDGVVTKIKIRATTIRNWDRKELLVPNKEFVTGRLLNWSLSDQTTRVVVVVGIAYGSDVDRAMALMREAAEETEHVLDDPAPVVSFEGFGDNALTLLLRAYLGSVEHRVATITALHKAINRKFAEAGISIAFPQRDLHMETLKPLQVQLLQPPADSGTSGNTVAPPGSSTPRS